MNTRASTAQPSRPPPADDALFTCDAPAADVPSALAERILAARYLSGGEFIYLALKPSRWYILLASVRWLALCAALLTFRSYIAASLGADVRHVDQLALATLILGVGIATAKWLGTLYMLSNWRVFCIRGVIGQQVLCLPLEDVAEVQLRERWFERLLGIGTISILAQAGPSMRWRYILDAQRIAATLDDAVRRSRR